MRKRPLCFMCITLVVLMWIIELSGGEISSPDIIYQEISDAVIYGKIYQCEYNEEKLILYLKKTILSDNSQKQKIEYVRITCDPENQKWQISDSICVKGDLKKIEGPTNPGQFDSRIYYNAKKVRYTMWEPKIELINRPKCSIERALFDLKMRLSNQYDQILPNQYGALLKGITLGEKNDIEDDITEVFQIGGISHILAISALHLQILGDGLYRMLRKLRVPVGIAAGISGVILIGYGILTGASVATVRALLMFGVRIGADVAGRTYDSVTGMALAAAILTAGNPSYLQYSGFWLSFCAVCSFMIFKERRKLASGILLYVFMAPVMLSYFYELSPYSIVLNIFVVPTIGFVIVSGVLGCVLGFGNILLGKIVIFPGAALLHIYKSACEICKRMPGNRILYGKPGWFQIMLFYGILIAALYFFRKNRIRKIRFIAYIFMIPAWIILTYHDVDGVQVTMLDVGQGDSIVVQTEGGGAYLIDGGSTSENKVGQYRIIPYLKYEGIDTLDAIFLTHADEDHISGIRELLKFISEERSELQVHKLILPNWKNNDSFSDVMDLAKKCEIDVFRYGKGGVMKDGDMKLTCIHPSGADYRNNTNEGSMVLRMDYKNFSMLFTGDLEGVTEEALLGTYGDVDVLKIAHHGSKYSTSEEFLQEVRPEIGLISCGENNFYGHPHEELLQRLETSGIVCFRTNLHGALILRSDGEKIDLKTFKQYNES